VAAAVVAVATRAGLAARREAIEIVHGLGATDGYIAGRFARRATLLAAIGAFAGASAGLPVLLGLANLAAPFAANPAAGASAADLAGSLPPALWLVVPGMPATAAAIGFSTAQATVRRWLRRLP
jgi:cell division transport system permease protein